MKRFKSVRMKSRSRWQNVNPHGVRIRFLQMGTRHWRKGYLCCDTNTTILAIQHQPSSGKPIQLWKHTWHRSNVTAPEHRYIPTEAVIDAARTTATRAPGLTPMEAMILALVNPVIHVPIGLRYGCSTDASITASIRIQHRMFTALMPTFSRLEDMSSQERFELLLDED